MEKVILNEVIDQGVEGKVFLKPCPDFNLGRNLFGPGVTDQSYMLTGVRSWKFWTDCSSGQTHGLREQQSAYGSSVSSSKCRISKILPTVEHSGSLFSPSSALCLSQFVICRELNILT